MICVNECVFAYRLCDKRTKIADGLCWAAAKSSFVSERDGYFGSAQNNVKLRVLFLFV